MERESGARGYERCSTWRFDRRKVPGSRCSMRMQMAARNNSLSLRIALNFGLLFPGGQSRAPSWWRRHLPCGGTGCCSASQLGTVKTIAGNVITMATDKGQTVAVTVATGAKVLKLPVGSTDLKTATPGELSDVAVGDRALVTGKAGDTPETFAAIRVILMKSSDIAQMQAAEQADWKTRGTGGIVSSVDPASARSRSPRARKRWRSRRRARRCSSGSRAIR